MKQQTRPPGGGGNMRGRQNKEREKQIVNYQNLSSDFYTTDIQNAHKDGSDNHLGHSRSRVAIQTN